MIEAVIGLERTATLLKARGGTEIEIPVRVPGSLIASIIGEEAATQLRDAFGAGRLTLPCSHMRGAGAVRLSKRKHAERLLRAGKSIQEVALEADLHIRTVRRYKLERAFESRETDEPMLPFDRDD
ncbi:hypothetical protein [Pseudaestuariivita sp.]|uniref:hypothetical protein n=1 Tax=Pseudaestuariivita sp. TaxID=2211669 RepID=UPI0040597FDD